MKLICHSFFISSTIILFFISPSTAQVRIHKNLNIEDGLVYSQVLSIHEDQAGYMWFGTSSGLSRWDGVSFKNFIFPEGVSDNNFKWICESSDSTIFFATRKGVVRYRDGSFSPLAGAPAALNNWIYSMMVSGDDKLYVATDTAGVWIYDSASFVTLDKDDGLHSNSARALARGENGRMIIADGDGLIYTCFENQLKQVHCPRLPQGLEITALLQDPDGALWIGTHEKGLFIFHRGTMLHFDHKDGVPGKSITFLSRGDDNQVFVSTNNGLALFENYRLHAVFDKKSGLSNTFIWQVFRDHNGLYYIGTDGGGVDIYRPGLFQTINAGCGLPHNTVWAICETAKHEFYFGTDEGLARLDENGVVAFDTMNGLSSNMILCLHKGAGGALYAGTNETGVDVIDNGGIRNLNSEQGLDGPSVWTITEDRDGLIYFGTYDGGINIWDGVRVIDTLNVADGLPSNAIVSSYRGADGSLFFGTDGGGVFRLNHGRVDSTLLGGNTVWSIFEDETGNFYFGTNSSGMIFFRNGAWDTLNVSDGLSHNSILGILKDDAGAFYLTTDNGLNIVEFLDDEVRIRLIGHGDGLAGNECNQGAYYKDSQGFLWFGTVNGVSRYDPSLDKPNPNAPKIHFARIQMFDRELPLTGHPGSFRYDENYFKFAFIGIDLLAPDKVTFKFKLSGVDKNWVVDSRPYAQYPHLDDGRYTFSVMAGSEWDRWSEPITYSFVIRPPFWKTWWFILLAVLVTVSPAVVVVRQRLKRLLAVERLRTKIAADLHDDIGAGLSEISILSAVIAAKMPPDVKSASENELNKIGQTARTLIDRMSDIVWLVNPKKDAISDLVSRLSDSFADVFEAKCIRFHCENSDVLQQARLTMEYRQHLFLIFKEAIHNAVKYSEADSLDLSIQLKGRKLNIRLRDNGKGFDPGGVSSGNGLHNMRERAAKIKGTLTVASEKGEGTGVEFFGVLTSGR